VSISAGEDICPDAVVEVKTTRPVLGGMEGLRRGRVIHHYYAL
jgi:hypothetical protein